MSLLTSPLSFWVSYSNWEKVDLIGLSLVAIGVLGEAVLIVRTIWFPYNPTDFAPLESVLGFKKKYLEILFGILVAIGVALELRALPKYLNESHDKIAELQNQTAQLVSTNLTLATQLEILKTPRRISPEQREKFIRILSDPHNVSKIPIKVIVGKSDSDTEYLAMQIREMLDVAGYGTKPSAFTVITDPSYVMSDGLWMTNSLPNIHVPPSKMYGIYEEIQQLPDMFPNTPTGQKVSDIIAIFPVANPISGSSLNSVMIWNPTTNSLSGRDSKGYSYHPTKDPNCILLGVMGAFSDVGISCGPMAGLPPRLVEPGQIAFLIPQRIY